MNKIQCISAMLFAILLVVANYVSGQQSPRRKQNFDENWKFSLGHAADPAKDFNFKVANIFAKAVKTETTAKYSHLQPNKSGGGDKVQIGWGR